MPTALSDADKVIRNDTGKAIAAALEALVAPEADKVAYDNTSSGLSADDVQDAIDELNTKNNTKMDKANPTGTGSLSINRKSDTTVGAYSSAVGQSVTASGNSSHAEGYNSVASNTASHAEGSGTTASGNRAHAEGVSTTASAQATHSEGESTTASGNYSHAEGRNSTASSVSSHAEGDGSTASGVSSHAEGDETTASGNYGAHSEGRKTTASGNQSHAEGSYTIANHRAQHVFGENNVADTSTATADSRGNYVEIVGNGSSDANRSNARTLDWSGNETLAGDLKINNTQSLSKLWTVLSGLTALSEKSGSIASFSTDIADKLFSCYVNVTAVQSGSGTPSPDNNRAISGWSGCNLVGCGKNLAKLTPRAQASVSGIISTIYDDNRIVANGTSSGNGDIGIELTNELKLDSDKSYTISLTGTDTRSASLNIFFHYKNGAYTSPIAISNSSHKVTFNNIGGIFDSILLRTSNTFTISLDAKLQIEVGTSQSTYESYNGTTHNIPFNTTVYGGVLDVLSGVMTNLCNDNSSLNSLTWYYNTTWSVFYANLPTDAKLEGGVDLTWFEVYAPSDASTWTGIADKTYILSPNLISSGRCALVIKDSNYNADTASTFASSLSGKKFVYPVATPTVIQLTPTEVKTILGQNNIFGDCGDIDLKYLETIGNRLT